MDTKSKNIIFGCIGLILFILFNVYCGFFLKDTLTTSRYALWIIFWLGIILEIFVCVPRFVINYHKLYNQPLGDKLFTAFIPHHNYVKCMNKVSAIICNILFIALLIVALGLIFPVWLNFAPNSLIMTFGEQAQKWVSVLVLLYCISVGIGLYGCKIDVDNIYSKQLQNTDERGVWRVLQIITKVVPFLDLIILIIPIGRCFTLMETTQKIKSLESLGINAFSDVSNKEDF